MTLSTKRCQIKFKMWKISAYLIALLQNILVSECCQSCEIPSHLRNITVLIFPIEKKTPKCMQSHLATRLSARVVIVPKPFKKKKKGHIYDSPPVLPCSLWVLSADWQAMRHSCSSGDGISPADPPAASCLACHQWWSSLLIIYKNKKSTLAFRRQTDRGSTVTCSMSPTWNAIPAWAHGISSSSNGS